MDARAYCSLLSLIRVLFCQLFKKELEPIWARVCARRNTLVQFATQRHRSSIIDHCVDTVLYVRACTDIHSYICTSSRLFKLHQIQYNWTYDFHAFNCLSLFFPHTIYYHKLRTIFVKLISVSPRLNCIQQFSNICSYSSMAFGTWIWHSVLAPPDKLISEKGVEKDLQYPLAMKGCFTVITTEDKNRIIISILHSPI